MGKLFILCSALLILLASCQNRKSSFSNDPGGSTSYPCTINLADGLKNPAELRLSEIADSIRYIVLSKDKKVAVNFIFYLAVDDSGIIAHVSQSPFLKFDINGNFIDTIGSIGRGPAEYLPGSKFAVNPVTDEIIVYRNFMHDFIIYDADGSFVGKHPLKTGTSMESFECLSSSRFALFPVYDGREVADVSVRKNMILLGLCNQDGNLLSSIIHPVQNIPSDFVPDKYMPGYPDSRNTYFNKEVVTPCYQNTVFKINSDSIYTGFRIKWGNLPVPETFEEKYYVRPSAGEIFAEIRGKVFETPTHAFFILSYKDKYLIDYEKQSDKVKSMMLPGQGKAGFINDIDGGQPFFPLWTNRKGDVWIDFDQAINFREQLTGNKQKEIDGADPKNKEKLVDFIRNLQPDDNPVIRIVYLKKDL